MTRGHAWRGSRRSPISLAGLHHLADFEVGPDAFAECLRQADFNYAYQAADDDEADLR